MNNKKYVTIDTETNIQSIDRNNINILKGQRIHDMIIVDETYYSKKDFEKIMKQFKRWEKEHELAKTTKAGKILYGK